MIYLSLSTAKNRIPNDHITWDPLFLRFSIDLFFFAHSRNSPPPQPAVCKQRPDLYYFRAHKHTHTLRHTSCHLAYCFVQQKAETDCSRVVAPALDPTFFLLCFLERKINLFSGRMAAPLEEHVSQPLPGLSVTYL